MYGLPSSNQNINGSNFFLPNYGMDAGASAPVAAAMQDQVSTQAVNNAAFPPAPVMNAGLGGLIGNPTAKIPTGTGLGFNTETAGLALGGLSTIGSLWNAWQSNKLAKEQFAFSKDFATANLNNSIQSYNTTLEDRINARVHTEGGTNREAREYVRDNRLNNTMKS